MAINLQRRDAFSKTFRQYEAVLDAFVRRNVKVIEPANGQELEFDADKVKRILVMQFAVRLLKSRAKGGTSQIEWFAFEATGRYISERQNIFGTAAITASDKYRAALSTYEQNLADTIFHALVTEAGIVCCKHNPEADQTGDVTACGKIRTDKCPHEEFVEADFWRDIFIALAGQNMENYGRALHVIVLDHMADFKDALDAAPDEAFVQ